MEGTRVMPTNQSRFYIVSACITNQNGAEGKSPTKVLGQSICQEGDKEV